MTYFCKAECNWFPGQRRRARTPDLGFLSVREKNREKWAISYPFFPHIFNSNAVKFRKSVVILRVLSPDYRFSFYIDNYSMTNRIFTEDILLKLQQNPIFFFEMISWNRTTSWWWFYWEDINWFQNLMVSLSVVNHRIKKLFAKIQKYNSIKPLIGSAGHYMCTFGIDIWPTHVLRARNTAENKR